MEENAKMKEAREAIRKVYSDTSVSVDETIESLQSLKDHISVMLESLATD